MAIRSSRSIFSNPAIHQEEEQSEGVVGDAGGVVDGVEEVPELQIEGLLRRRDQAGRRRLARNGNGSARRVLKKSLFPRSPSSSLLRRSGCSRTISNLRDVIRSSNQQQHEGCASPRSIGSSDVQTHDALLVAARGSASGRDLRTPPPGHGWSPFQHSPLLMRCSTTPSLAEEVPAPPRGVRHRRGPVALSELAEEDSARGVVEIICMAGWPKPEAALDRGGADREDPQRAERRVARYEEFRGAVMARAAQLPKKHPRCIADGNELLQFHATTVSCSLGAAGLCTSGRCDVCRIIRHGFSVVTTTREDGGGGVFTTSTSRRALEHVVQDDGEEEATEKGSVKRALLVCRVIAGRIHRPLENLQGVAAAQTGFDSFAGKVGPDSTTVEELYLLNPRALLPCYVVIYKS
ncbi:hypothetical protein PR202_ga14597 [Eleusine coracana subsp. coracana]|uniref:Uncharacterized protein n=1 Tax=Eleusine coracana subsp. coracana TaxID=191504 RepID=A0AAV5CGX1_ELECO|nr:hypothetical protein PR202_ga14597 [Eleusine coracana subsp. coracana]